MRTISLTIAAVLLCLTISGHAEAHARLKAAIPAVGAIVSDAPQQLRLTFSEPVEAGAVVVDVGTSRLRRTAPS